MQKHPTLRLNVLPVFKLIFCVSVYRLSFESNPCPFHGFQQRWAFAEHHSNVINDTLQQLIVALYVKQLSIDCWQFVSLDRNLDSKEDSEYGFTS